MKKIELYVSDEDAALLTELLGRMAVNYVVFEVESAQMQPFTVEPEEEQPQFKSWSELFAILPEEDNEDDDNAPLEELLKDL